MYLVLTILCCLLYTTNKQQEKRLSTVDKSETPLVEPVFEILLRQIVAMLRQIISEVGIKTTNCS